MAYLILSGVVAYFLAMYQLCKRGMVGGAQLLLIITLLVILFI